MNPSDTNLEKIAKRLDAFKNVAIPSDTNKSVIDDAIHALRSAEKVLIEAGFFLEKVQFPHELHLVWPCGNGPLPPLEALKVLGEKALPIEDMIALELYPRKRSTGDSSQTEIHSYLVTCGRAEITIESLVQLSVDEVCQMALRCFGTLRVSLAKIMQVVSTDFGGPDDPVVVSTEVQLRNAGMLSERRGV